jgi:hypothetical protein
MDKKRISGLALASFIVSICSGVVPFLLSFVGTYYQIPAFPSAGYLGIFLAASAVILGISALVIISKNKSAICGYARAIIGIIIGMISFISYMINLPAPK